MRLYGGLANINEGKWALPQRHLAWIRRHRKRLLTWEWVHPRDGGAAYLVAPFEVQQARPSWPDTGLGKSRPVVVVAESVNFSFVVYGGSGALPAG